jgi:hypothetical protein
VTVAGGSDKPDTLVGALQKAAVWLVSGIGVAALVAALGGAALQQRPLRWCPTQNWWFVGRWHWRCTCYSVGPQ